MAFNDIRDDHPELLVAMHKALGRAKYYTNDNQTVSVEGLLSQRTLCSPKLIMAIKSVAQPRTFKPGEWILKLNEPSQVIT